MKIKRVHKYLLIIACVHLFSIKTVLSENIYSEESFINLTADKKARRIGDTVTILIIEKAVAESRANTANQKSFGFSTQAENPTNNGSASIDIQNRRSGDAVTRRNGFVSGQITVTVLNVNEIGHLMVSGQQKIIINGEEQSILVEGALRREDIMNNNTALSSRLTNARIEFVGEGDVSDSQKKGFIATILGWLGLA